MGTGAGGRRLLRLRNGVSARREQRGPGCGLGRDTPGIAKPQAGAQPPRCSLPAPARAQRPRPSRRGGPGPPQPPTGRAAGEPPGVQPAPAKPLHALAHPFAKLRVFTSPGQELGGFRSPPCPGLRLYFSRRESRFPHLNLTLFCLIRLGKARVSPLPRAHLPTGGIAGSRSPGHGTPDRGRGAPKHSGFARGWENGTGSAPAVNPRSKSRGSRPSSPLLRGSAGPGAERPAVAGAAGQIPRPRGRLV